MWPPDPCSQIGCTACCRLRHRQPRVAGAGGATIRRDVDEGGSSSDQHRDEGGKDHDFGCGNDDPHHEGGGPAGSGDSSAAGEGDARARELDLDNVHTLKNEYVGAEVVDGQNLRLAPEALRSPYFQCVNLTEQLVSVWSLTTRPSRRSLQLLLNLLRYKDRLGRRFNPEMFRSQLSTSSAEPGRGCPSFDSCAGRWRVRVVSPGKLLNARSTWFFSGIGVTASRGRDHDEPGRETDVTRRARS